jgi:hypothetical protein
MFSRNGNSEVITVPPVVIGAMGGSGTRAIVNIVRLAGCWMGGRVSRRTQDSVPTRFFLNKWFETLLDFPDITPRAQRRARTYFHRAIREHRQGIAGTDSSWGWKNPRNMWLIPFYLSIYPQLKFIHVVRDGRDMSLSSNLFLLETHGRRLLGRGWQAHPERAQMELWTMGNIRGAEAAQRCAPGHYFLLRYEDLCFRSRETVEKLYDFLGAAKTLVDRAAEEIQPSPGIGRGSSKEPLPGTEREQAAFAGVLERFGYSL